MARRLVELLHHAFESGTEQLVTLDRELALLGHYLDIQKIRFQDRLRTDIRS